jgi:hypothetical protein
MQLSAVTQAARQRLIELNTAPALDIVGRLDRQEISEKRFISEANGYYKTITSSDAAGALQRSARLHAPSTPKGLSLPEGVYKQVFATSDRGKRVTSVEKLINDGLLNPMEVLNA